MAVEAGKKVIESEEPCAAVGDDAARRKLEAEATRRFAERYMNAAVESTPELRAAVRRYKQMKSPKAAR